MHCEPRNELALQLGRPPALHLDLARHRLEVDGTPRERIVLEDWHDHGHYLEAGTEGIHVREITS